MIIEEFNDGYAIYADSTDKATMTKVHELVGNIGLIIADPPYGNIVNEKWDKVKTSDSDFANWMSSWTRDWANTILIPGGAFYVWGGIGIPAFRPFLKYVVDVEELGKFELANLITWKKKRAYGLSHNYLFVREECAYFINGNAKKPAKFNIPFLEEKRGYEGYNKKYPAKSEFYRRTNVWTDITEIMRGKSHPTQKALKLCEIMIEIHTDLGDYVLDPFSGGGTTAFAARKLGRKFVIIESDKEYFDKTVTELRRS